MFKKCPQIFLNVCFFYFLLYFHFILSTGHWRGYIENIYIIIIFIFVIFFFVAQYPAMSSNVTLVGRNVLCPDRLRMCSEVPLSVLGIQVSFPWCRQYFQMSLFFIRVTNGHGKRKNMCLFIISSVPMTLKCPKLRKMFWNVLFLIRAVNGVWKGRKYVHFYPLMCR